MDTSSTTQVAKIMGKYWRSRGTSWTFFWSPISWIVMGKTNRRSFIRNWMGESTELGMYVPSSKTRVISASTCGWHQNGWKEAEHGSHVEETDEKIGHWRTHIISWPCLLGMHSEKMQPGWNNHWTIHKNVWITYFCWNNWKTARERHCTQKLWRGPTTWKDMLRNASCDTVNWQTRKWSHCTNYRILVWMIINSNRRSWNQLENCQMFARKLSCNPCTWHELVDLTFYGQSTSLQDQSQNGRRHVTDD